MAMSFTTQLGQSFAGWSWRERTRWRNVRTGHLDRLQHALCASLQAFAEGRGSWDEPAAQLDYLQNWIAQVRAEGAAIAAARRASGSVQQVARDGDLQGDDELLEDRKV